MRRVFFEGKLRFVFIPVIAIAAISLVSFVVMQLWNNLLPDILHVGTVTFWQAMGIFVLCKLLFGFGGKGGGRFGGGGPWMRRKMAEKLKNMSPEDRESFKEQMKNRMCGPRGRRGWGSYNWDEDENAAKTETPNA